MVFVVFIYAIVPGNDVILRLLPVGGQDSPGWHEAGRETPQVSNRGSFATCGQSAADRPDVRSCQEVLLTRRKNLKIINFTKIG